MNQKNRRIKYFINPEVQIGYIKFLFLYWFVYFSISIIGFLGIFIVQLNADDTREVTYRLVQIYQNNFIYLFIFMLFHFSASLLMGLYFFRSFSHRVCGPIYNIEKRIKEMNENPDLDNYSEIKTRTNDYFQPLVDQLNQLLKTKKIIKADEPKKNGFGLVELLVAVGLVGILAAGMTGMLTGTMKQQKGIQAKDQQLQITSELRALLNNKTICTAALKKAGKKPAAPGGYEVDEIKDSLGNPIVEKNKSDRSGLLKVEEIRVSGWVPDLAFPAQGNTAVSLKFTKIGETQTVRELKPMVITLKAKLGPLGDISECYSIGQQSDGFWQPSAAELNTIFYPAGKVGIGTDTVGANNSMRVHSPTGQGVISVSGISDAGLTYSALYLAGNNTEIKDNSWGIVHKNDALPVGQPTKESFQIVRWKAGVPMAVGLSILDDAGYEGFVGIGTGSPKAKLDIAGGEIRIASSGAACTAENEGALRYAAGSIQFCNGINDWKPVGGGGGFICVKMVQHHNGDGRLEGLEVIKSPTDITANILPASNGWYQDWIRCAPM